MTTQWHTTVLQNSGIQRCYSTVACNGATAAWESNNHTPRQFARTAFERAPFAADALLPLLKQQHIRGVCCSIYRTTSNHAYTQSTAQVCASDSSSLPSLPAFRFSLSSRACSFLSRSFRCSASNASFSRSYPTLPRSASNIAVPTLLHHTTAPPRPSQAHMCKINMVPLQDAIPYTPVQGECARSRAAPPGAAHPAAGA